MKRFLCCVCLLGIALAGVAEAGQYKIGAPPNMRKHQPPRGYRESRLEITNTDDRGYALDVDYRRNRIQLEQRGSGDIFIPANSSIILTFDDDDDWRIVGDNESLNIEIRSGRTSSLRLETRVNRGQIGLFATVGGGHRGQTVQLFKYHMRHAPPPPVVVTRPGHHQPPPVVVHQPPVVVHQPPPVVVHQPPPVVVHQPPHHGPPPTTVIVAPPPRRDPSLGDLIGGAVDAIMDKDGRPRR